MSADMERSAHNATVALAEYDRAGVMTVLQTVPALAQTLRELLAAVTALSTPPADDVHPAHSGHRFGGGYARASVMLAGDPDWINATGGQPADDVREAVEAERQRAAAHAREGYRANETCDDITKRILSGEPAEVEIPGHAWPPPAEDVREALDADLTVPMPNTQHHVWERLVEFSRAYRAERGYPPNEAARTRFLFTAFDIRPPEPATPEGDPS